MIGTETPEFPSHLQDGLLGRKLVIQSNKLVFCTKLTLWGVFLCATFLSYSLYTYLPYSQIESPEFSEDVSIEFSVYANTVSFGIFKMVFPFKYELVYDKNCMDFIILDMTGFTVYGTNNRSNENICSLTINMQYTLLKGLDQNFQLIELQGFIPKCAGDYTLYTTGKVDSSGSITSKRSHQECKIVSGVDNQYIFIGSAFNNFQAQQYKFLSVLFFVLALASLLWHITYNIINKAMDWKNQTKTVKLIYLDESGNINLRV